MSRGGAVAVAQLVKLTVPAGKATPSPPIGPALGARGVKAIEFCKLFNAQTAHLVPETPTPVHIQIAPDRTFTFTLRTPPTTYLLKRAAGVDPKSKVSASSNNTVTLKHIYEIGRIKAGDAHLKEVGLESICRSILGSCRTLGLKVVP